MPRAVRGTCRDFRALRWIRLRSSWVVWPAWRGRGCGRLVGVDACGRAIGELMAGQPGAGRGPGRPEIIKLGSVPGVVLLVPPDPAACAGGARLAPGVTIAA